MENDASSYKKAVMVAIGISVFFTVLILVHYRQISSRPGTVIIPAGGTYLGPTIKTIHGHLYPYSFEVPENISLVTFPRDPYDMYAIAGSDPASNVLIVVDNLSRDNAKNQYINEPKTAYINAWWKQFSNLTGVKNMESFTNSKGLTGYNVTFLTAAGEASSQDVFFEVPGHPEYVIHLSNGILNPEVFTKIVDSVAWETK